MTVRMRICCSFARECGGWLRPLGCWWIEIPHRLRHFPLWGKCRRKWEGTGGLLDSRVRGNDERRL